MGRVMRRDRDDVMMDSNQAGVDRVLSGGGEYAFFMESTSIEYQVIMKKWFCVYSCMGPSKTLPFQVERNCKLQQVGGTLDSKSYGIAVQQGIEISVNE